MKEIEHMWIDDIVPSLHNLLNHIINPPGFSPYVRNFCIKWPYRFLPTFYSLPFLLGAANSKYSTQLDAMGYDIE